MSNHYTWRGRAASRRGSPNLVAYNDLNGPIGALPQSGKHAPALGQSPSAENRIYRVAIELSRPVAKGLLSRSHAYPALTITVCRAADLKRAPEAVRDIAWHLLRLHAHQLSVERTTTSYRIARAIRPMIAMQDPKGCIIAEAHSVNAAGGWPLTAPEAEPAAWLAAWDLMERRRSHG